MKSLLCLLSIYFTCNIIAYSQEIYLLPGSTQKIDQLVGDYDRHQEKATKNLTETKYQIWGTDLGVPFNHDGKTYLLFGDIPGDIGYGVDRDPIAFTTDSNPENGLTLQFITESSGNYRPITIPGISQSTLEVPLDGISIDGTMYIYHSTDQMNRSVLAKSKDDGRTFTLVDNNVSDQFFINISVNKVTNDEYPELPGSEKEGLIAIGSGEYRKSSAYLYHQPIDHIEDDQYIRYFAGLQNNKPTWSTIESDCQPIIEESCIGEVSSAFNPHLNKWMVVYNCDNPRGILMRLSDKPWGPYSPPIVLFDPDRDDGYCHFIHANWQVRNCDSVHDPGRENEWGGEYGPYLFKNLTTRNDTLVTIYYTMSTWNPYTSVLMKSVLVIPDETSSTSDENLVEEIHPYPNPTKRIFELPIPDFNDHAIRLLNAEGQVVFISEGNRILDISQLPAGIYLGSVWLKNKPKYFFKVFKLD